MWATYWAPYLFHHISQHTPAFHGVNIYISSTFADQGLDERWNTKKNHVKENYQSNPYYSRLLITVIYHDSTKILNTVVEYSLSVVYALIIYYWPENWKPEMIKKRQNMSQNSWKNNKMYKWNIYQSEMIKLNRTKGRFGITTWPLQHHASSSISTCNTNMLRHCIQ